MSFAFPSGGSGRMFDQNQKLLPRLRKVSTILIVLYSILFVDTLLPTRRVKAEFIEEMSVPGMIAYSTNTVLFDSKVFEDGKYVVFIERSLLLGIAYEVIYKGENYALRNPKKWYIFLYAIPIILSLTFFISKDDNIKHAVGLLNGALFIFSILLAVYLLAIYNL